jgi:hypothetical protein
MLNQVELDRILFLDIETVPEVYLFEELDGDLRELWSEKTRFLQQREDCGPDEIYERAGIYAEFGKIICISTAIFYEREGRQLLRVKSYCNDDDKKLLAGFSDMLSKFGRSENRFLCGHNAKEFDFPYMARRMLIQEVPLPDMLDLAGKKPWEVRHLDTMELWKFGDYKHYTSLNLLSRLFRIPTPKSDISGSDVARVYWEEKDLDRIRTYCEKDTIAVARLMQRLKGRPMIEDHDIEIV